MNVYRGGSGTESYYPPESENGLLWMRLTVANTGASARAFKFNRVRLIGADFVSNGRIVFSRLPFAEEGPSITLKPGCTASRWVVFTRSKNSLPYMLVYDDVENNEIVDRMTINLPDHAMDE